MVQFVFICAWKLNRWWRIPVELLEGLYINIRMFWIRKMRESNRRSLLGIVSWNYWQIPHPWARSTVPWQRQYGVQAVFLSRRIPHMLSQNQENSRSLGESSRVFFSLSLHLRFALFVYYYSLQSFTHSFAKPFATIHSFNPATALVQQPSFAYNTP